MPAPNDEFSQYARPAGAPQPLLMNAMPAPAGDEFSQYARPRSAAAAPQSPSGPSAFDRFIEASPLGMGPKLMQMIDHPVEALSGLGESLGQTNAAVGRLLSLHAQPTDLASAVPILGPAAVATAQHLATPGQRAQGLGEATNFMLPLEGLPERPSLVNLGEVTNPEAALARALGPKAAHTEFEDIVPGTAANIKFGESITGQPIQDVNSATAATQAAMQANRAALEPFKQAMRTSNQRFDMAQVRRAMSQAIAGIKDTNPAEWHALQKEINQRYGKRLLDVDETFNALAQNNAERNAFYNAAPGAQASKLVGNLGDARILKAEGDALRKALYSAPGGEDAARLQQEWGGMNQMLSYLQNKKNTVLGKEEPITRGETIKNAVEGVPKGFGMNDLLNGAIGRALQVPSGTNEILERTFKGVQPANPPNWMSFSPFGTSYGQRGLLPAPLTHPPLTFTPPNLTGAAEQFRAATQAYPGMEGMISRETAGRALPPASSTVGVSGVTVPDLIGQARRATGQMNAGPLQLPPASSQVGVSGTTVPDIIARSSRGQGTSLPLLTAPPEGIGGTGNRVQGVAQPFSEVAGPGARTVGPLTPLPGTAKGFTPAGTVPETANQAQRRALSTPPATGSANAQRMAELDRVALKLTGQRYSDLDALNRSLIDELAQLRK